MTAATKDINTPERKGTDFEHPVAAATKIFAGSIVCLNDSGFAAPGNDDADLRCVGCARAKADNSSGEAGDINVKVRRSVFRFDNSKTHAVTRAHIGGWAYVEDDHTVARATSDSVRAGIIVDLDDDGVWVDMALIVPAEAMS